MSIIKVIMIDAKGNTLDAPLSQELRILDDLLPEYADPAFPYLGYLDPYGDTIFSSFQMKPFREEWRRLRGKSPSASQTQMLDIVDGLALRCEQTVHNFLRFMGD